MWMYSKTILGTIFKARQKIIMKSVSITPFQTEMNIETLSGKLQQQRTRGIAFKQDSTTTAAVQTRIPLTACFIFSSRALFSGLW